jgi:hypothetical protein
MPFIFRICIFQHLKQMIADVTAVHPDHQILYYENRAIVNGDQLAVYGFQARGVINLMGKVKGGE